MDILKEILLKKGEVPDGKDFISENGAGDKDHN
jgi:hypothetical protein